MGSLINGFQLLGVSSYWVNEIQGALILVIVAATSRIALALEARRRDRSFDSRKRARIYRGLARPLLGPACASRDRLDWDDPGCGGWRHRPLGRDSSEFSSLAFVFLVLGGHAVWLSALAGLASGLAVGLFNAFFIGGFRDHPIPCHARDALHRSQRTTASDRRRQSGLSSVIGRSAILRFSWARRGFWRPGRACRRRRPRPFEILLKRSRLGKSFSRLAFTAASPGTLTADFQCQRFRYALSALVCAVAGLILSATVNVYVPYSGNAFLLNAIGATFIGTTPRSSRPAKRSRHADRRAAPRGGCEWTSSLGA